MYENLTSRFTTTLSEGNGKRAPRIELVGPESKGITSIPEALAALVELASEGHAAIKLDIKIDVEAHEHKYFVSPGVSEERQYTAIPAPAACCVPGEGWDENMRKWRQELEHFERLRSTLLKDRTLRQKFVAIHGGKVVDNDADEFALAKRVFRAFADQVVLIARVEPATRIVEMPSPELA